MLETNNVPMMMTMNNIVGWSSQSMMMTMSYKAHFVNINLNIRQGWHYPNKTIESVHAPTLILMIGNNKVEVFKERANTSPVEFILMFIQQK